MNHIALAIWAPFQLCSPPIETQPASFGFLLPKQLPRMYTGERCASATLYCWGQPQRVERRYVPL
jgi:hypothetical protein